MIGLLLGIDFYEQLKKVSDAQTVAQVNEIIGELVESGGERLSEDEPFVFCFDETRPGAYLQAAQAVWRAYESLKAILDQLYGFTIILDLLERSIDSETVKDIKQQRFAFTKPCSISMTERVRAKLSDYFASDKDNEFFTVSDFQLRTPVSAQSIAVYLEDDRQADKLLEWINPFLCGERLASMLFIKGQSERGRDHVLNQALGMLFGDKGQRLDMVGSEFNSQGYIPFIDLIESDICQKASTYMAKPEQALFEELQSTVNYLRRALFRTSFPEHIQRSFSIFMKLYITLNIRIARAASLPLIFTCYNYQSLSEASRKLLNELISSFKDEQSILFFITGYCDIPVIDGVAIAGIELPSVTRDRLRKMWQDLMNKLPPPSEEALAAFISETDGDILAFHQFMVMVNLGILPREKRSEFTSISGTLFRSMPGDLKEILYILKLSARVLSPAIVDEFLHICNIARPSFDIAIRRLVEFGFIQEGSPLRLSNEIPRTVFKRDLGDRAVEIERRFFAFILDLNSRGEAFLSIEFLETMQDMIEVDDPAFRVECIFHDLNEGMEIGEDFKNAKAAQIDNIAECFVALRSDDLESAARAFSRLQKAFQPGQGEGVLRAYKDSADSAYLYSISEMDASLSNAKNALMLFQEVRNPRGESMANRMLGLSMFASGQLLAAMDYFAISYEISTHDHDVYESMVNALFEAIATFAYGNYTKVMRLIDRSAKYAQELLRKDYEIYACFLKGRAYLELGLYDEAEKAFLYGIAENRIYGFVGVSELFSTWLARVLAYTGRARRALAILGDLPETLDTCLISEEVSVCLEDYNEVSRCFESCLQYGDRFSFDSPDRLNWLSGFALVEDRYLGRNTGDRVALHIAEAFDAYSKGYQGKAKEGLAAMYQITRERKLSEADPNNPLYYYLYYSLMPEMSDSSSIDKATILSKAFKYLQQRSSRIESITHRNSYLASFWNQKIIDAAKSYKLM